MEERGIDHLVDIQLLIVIGISRHLKRLGVKPQDETVEEKLDWLQTRLQTLCSDVAAPIERNEKRSEVPRVQPGWDADLESEIDKMQKDLIKNTTYVNEINQRLLFQK